MENKFIVEQKPILSILAAMQPICTKRTTVEATNYILFHIGHRELVLKSTDMEVSLQSSYILKESNTQEPYEFLVSGRRIFDLVKELEGDIQCTLHNQQLALKAGAVDLALNIKDAQEFPPFPERIENMMQLEADFLMEMFNNVAFLIPQNNANPALNGLLLEVDSQGLKMTSTDGHCLAQASSNLYSLEDGKKWLLPRRAIFEVKKILESTQEKTVFLGVCGSQLVFSGETFNFFTKLLTNQFPQYETILKRDGFIPAKVDRVPLIKTLRRSTCLLSGQFLATKFGFSAKKIQVSMHNKEVGTLEEEIPLAQYAGDTMDIRFYAPYLLNGLQIFSDDKIDFYLKDSVRPIIFEAEGNDKHLLYLVMPVSPTSTAS